MSRTACFISIIVWFLIAQPIQARQNTPQQSPWKVSGSLRVRFEGWDFFKASTGDNAYGYGAALLRVAVGRQWRSHDWFFELAQPSLIGLPREAIAPAPQGQLGFGGTYFASNPGRLGIFLKQGYVRLKSRLRLGRFEFGDGLETAPEGALGVLKRDRVASRLIGNFGFTHVGRSIDGVHFSHGVSTANLTVMAGRPTEGVFQVKGMRELNVDVVYGALTTKVPRLGQGEGRVFGMYYHDGRDTLKTDNRSLLLRLGDFESIGITTIGANYINVFDAGIGKADALAWGVVQTGTWGKLDHRSHAIAVEAGYQVPNIKLKPWFRAGYFRGSGDDNPSDGVHKTFFQLLPTPRPFARFPLYNLMNSEDTFAQLTFIPHPKWSLRSEAHSLRLTDAADLWYSGGGAFQKETFGYAGRPSGGQKELAAVFDLSADYQLDAKTTLGFYVAIARGKGAIRNVFPTGQNAKFGLIELTRRF